MDSFHISATGHSIKYLPEYLAQELGFFTDVDLNVTVDVPNPWARVLTDLNEGKAQAVLGGIWVPAMYSSRVRDYQAFAQLSNRCPLVLVSRSPIETFTWDLLENKTVLVPGGNGASPYLYLAGLLKQAEFDLTRATFIHDLATPMLAELFSGGMGDILVTHPAIATSLIQNNVGYHMASLTEVGGPIPWSVYYALPELLDRDEELYGRFTLAIQRATTWIREHDAEDTRDIVTKHWPDSDIDSMVKLINYYRQHEAWTETVQIKEEELSTWQNMLVDGGLIDKPIPYDELVDSRPYKFAKAKLTNTN